MKPCIQITAILLTLSAAITGNAQQYNDEPLTDNWAPSEWGPDDKAGAVNRTTPEMVLKAMGLVRQGKVATLGKIYASDAPVFGERAYRLSIPGLPTGDALGPQRVVYNDELVTAEIGQVGTQFDGPGHIGVRTSKGHFYYNGRYLEDPDVTVYGLGPLGVEHVGQKSICVQGRIA